MNTFRFDIVSIEAWRDEFGGWYWNNSSYIARDQELSFDRLTPRKLCKFMREEGYLEDYSKGRIRVDFAGSDPEIIEFQKKSDFEPIFAMIGTYQEDTK